MSDSISGGSNCSDEEKLSVSVSLMIGYDESKTDIPCLSVSTYDGSHLNIIKVLYGTEAKNVYKKLTEIN